MCQVQANVDYALVSVRGRSASSRTDTKVSSIPSCDRFCRPCRSICGALPNGSKGTGGRHVDHTAGDHSARLLAVRPPPEALSMYPGTLRAAAGDSIRPFTIHVPQAALDGLRQRIAATRWPENRRGSVAGRPARDHAGTRTLLGDRLRLAQVPGEAQRGPAVHHRDRWAGHPFHSRPFEARKCLAARRRTDGPARSSSS